MLNFSISHMHCARQMAQNKKLHCLASKLFVVFCSAIIVCVCVCEANNRCAENESLRSLRPAVECEQRWRNHHPRYASQNKRNSPIKNGPVGVFRRAGFREQLFVCMSNRHTWQRKIIPAQLQQHRRQRNCGRAKKSTNDEANSTADRIVTSNKTKMPHTHTAHTHMHGLKMQSIE